MEDNELLTLYTEVQNDSIKAEKVLQTYLTRAKNEKDTLKMAGGYERLARIFSHKKNVKFADSLILLTDNFNTNKYPCYVYLIKAH